ncbi:MAG: hypothetical protein ACKN9T_13140 [Candidatus Methylumidiphilus sp.]
MSTELEVEWHRLLFGVRRSIRYHQKRIAFYSFCNTITNVLVLICSSAAFSLLLANRQDKISMYCSLFVTIITTVELIIGTTRKSVLHESLKRRFINLEQEIMNTEETKTKQKYTKFYKERLFIETDEPPPLRVLDAICHNELMRSMGYDKSGLATIKWYQRLFSQFIDIKSHAIE